MEKKAELSKLKYDLLNVKYQDLLWRIVGAVRRTAKTIPAFRDSHNGCIRITIVPLCEDAEIWFGGGLSEYQLFDSESMGHEVTDVCEREFVFKIDSRGSHTIQWADPNDGHTEPVNCYGYSALKTAYASRINLARRGQLNDNGNAYGMQYFIEDNGWSMHDGSVCTTVSIAGSDFIMLYVCTSGAKSSEDRACSLAGMLEAQKFFVRLNATAKFDPHIDGDEEPLEQTWDN